MAVFVADDDSSAVHRGPVGIGAGRPGATQGRCQRLGNGIQGDAGGHVIGCGSLLDPAGCLHRHRPALASGDRAAQGGNVGPDIRHDRHAAGRRDTGHDGECLIARRID